VYVILHLRRPVAELSSCSRARQFSTQINVVLVVQAVSPLVFELTPNILTAASTMLGVRISTASAMFTALLNWAPLVNALSIMLIVRPYRQAVWRMATRGKYSYSQGSGSRDLALRGSNGTGSSGIAVISSDSRRTTISGSGGGVPGSRQPTISGSSAGVLGSMRATISGTQTPTGSMVAPAGQNMGGDQRV